MTVSSRLVLPLLAVVVIGATLGFSWGFYSRPAMTLMLAALALALTAALGRERLWRFPSAAALLAAAAVVVSGNAVFAVEILYPDAEAKVSRWLIHAAAVAGFVLVTTFLLDVFAVRGSAPTFWPRVLLLFAAGAVLRAGVLWASPDPVIDVYVALRDAPEHLLHGRNPYTSPYECPYVKHGYREPEQSAAYPFYPPLPFLLALPFRAAGLDVRWANVVCDLLAALVLLEASRSRGRPLIGALAGGIHLNLPATPFMIEQAWYEPMIAALLGGGLLLAERCRWAGQLVLALALTGKQYGIVLLPLVAKAQWGRRRALLVSLAVVGVAVFLPFVVWDAEAFQNVILFSHLARPAQTNSITILSAANDLFGLPPTGVLRVLTWAGIVLLTAALTWRTPAGGTAAGLWLGTALLVFYLFHTQGYFNYFWLSAYLLLLGIVGLATIQDPFRGEPGASATGEPPVADAPGSLRNGNDATR